MRIREKTEELERQNLSEFASLACASRGRLRQEIADPIRTCYQRDRDRILHSKSFRRLKHKTQVFISPSGDHYRTRLTHTLEVSQIARTVARALRLNEDLAEAIALGHDVGHTPFGHAGEEALDEAIREHRPSLGFKHYEQSVRVVTALENDGAGLNLTVETIDGIACHSKGRADLEAEGGENVPSLEASVVRIADRIAYLNHDLDDALRADWFGVDEMPAEVASLGRTGGKRIGAMVLALIENSLDKPAVSFDAQMLTSVNVMKDFLFEKLYLEYPKRFPDIAKAQGVVKALFGYYFNYQEKLPDGYKGLQGAVDYVSGMTDRFAMNRYGELFLPDDWEERLTD